MSNINWARLQIVKHGRDRYPDWPSQLRKLVEEVGEVNKELNRSPVGDPAIGAECADVALALYNLCDKLGIDLDKEIRKKVEGDDRTFS